MSRFLSFRTLPLFFHEEEWGRQMHFSAGIFKDALQLFTSIIDVALPNFCINLVKSSDENLFQMLFSFFIWMFVLPWAYFGTHLKKQLTFFLYFHVNIANGGEIFPIFQIWYEKVQKLLMEKYIIYQNSYALQMLEFNFRKPLRREIRYLKKNTWHI